MAGIPRILVVDPTSYLGDLVRAAMIMLDRRYIMVEIPDFNEALDEMYRTNVTLAVTAHYITDELSGIDWSERAIREQASANIIVVGSHEDPRPDAKKLENAPFQFVNYDSGEPFLRAIRVGLDGKEVVEAEESSGKSETVDYGSIPTIDIDAARGIVSNTRLELGAIGALLANRVGRILIDDGAMSYVDKEQIAPLLGPIFPKTIKLAPQIGGNGWLLNYFEGERYNIFALSIGYHYFVLFLMDASAPGALGAVTRYGRQGASRLVDLLGDSAWQHGQVAAPTPTKDKTGELIPVEAAIEAEPEEQPTEDMADLSAKLFETQLEPVDDLDLDLLFGQEVADDDLDDLIFAENSLEIQADLLKDDGIVSFEEAQNMGLLD